MREAQLTVKREPAILRREDGQSTRRARRRNEQK
jgi:hypothetical protein